MNNVLWHRVGIKATPSAVYQALTDAKKLSLWWTTDVRGKSEIGENLEFRFGQFCQTIQVTALEIDQCVRWLATENGLADWVGTEIEFTIEVQSDQTFVFFRQTGWRDGTEMFPHYSMRWSVFLLSLKDFLETGKGHPSPHDIAISY
jgi:uncharacterized protein YndB with AHSA1/START domain